MTLITTLVDVLCQPETIVSDMAIDVSSRHSFTVTVRICINKEQLRDLQMAMREDSRGGFMVVSATC